MGYLGQVVRDARPRPRARSVSVPRATGLAVPAAERLVDARLMASRPAAPPGTAFHGTEDRRGVGPEEPAAQDAGEEGPEVFFDAPRPLSPMRLRRAGRDATSGQAMAGPERISEAVRPGASPGAARRGAPVGGPSVSPARAAAKLGEAALRADPAPITPKIRGGGAPRHSESASEAPEAAGRDAPERVAEGAAEFIPESVSDEARPAPEAAHPSLVPEIRVPAAVPEAARAPVWPEAAPRQDAVEVRIAQVEVVVSEPPAPQPRASRTRPAPPPAPSRFHVRRV